MLDTAAVSYKDSSSSSGSESGARTRGSGEVGGGVLLSQSGAAGAPSHSRDGLCCSEQTQQLFPSATYTCQHTK